MVKSLFDILSGKNEGESFEGTLYDAVCFVSKFIWAFVIVKWINFEIWWWIGDGPFAWHRCGIFSWHHCIASD